MPFIIDGHNLIPKIPGLSLDQIDDETDLIRFLQAFSRQTRKKIEVYFDKAPPGSTKRRRLGRVTAYFVPESSTADAAIKRRLRALGKAAKNWTVVSADRDILLTAKSLQAKTLSPGEFVRAHLDVPGPGEESIGTNPDVEVSNEEINEWLDLFGGE
jgi:predicted RNA-binding protein with PIN domain